MKKSFILWRVQEQPHSQKTEVGSYPEGTRLNPCSCLQNIPAHLSP
jgi:hypothetical protein